MSDTARTYGNTPSERARPEERTTLNFTSGQMASLKTRKALREQRAADNKADAEGFNHAEFLKSVREAESDGTRGTLKQLTTGGVLSGQTGAPAADAASGQGDGTPAGSEWVSGPAAAGQGGEAAGDGVTAETATLTPSTGRQRGGRANR